MLLIPCEAPALMLRALRKWKASKASAVFSHRLPLPLSAGGLNTNQLLPHDIGIDFDSFGLDFGYVDDIGVDFFF